MPPSYLTPGAQRSQALGARGSCHLFTPYKRGARCSESSDRAYSFAEMPLLQLTPHICVASLPEQTFARIVFLLHNRNWLDETQSCESASARAVLSRGTASNRLFISEMSLGEFFCVTCIARCLICTEFNVLTAFFFHRKN